MTPAHQIRVLVVEDDPSTGEVLSNLLSRRGYSVVAIKSVTGAIVMMGTEIFDLLICDIGLPDGNGWDLLENLRQTNPHLKAIALTGYGFEADIEHSKRSGFAAHITKPADMPTIESHIRSLFPQSLPDPVT